MKEIITKLAESVTEDKLPDKVGDQGNTLVSNVTAIINAVIGVLGLVCVVVMIIGGVNYMTSSGDAAKVKKAKDTILYGLIGLVVCVLAFALVNFVIVTSLAVTKKIPLRGYFFYTLILLNCNLLRLFSLFLLKSNSKNTIFKFSFYAIFVFTHLHRKGNRS